MPVVVLLGPPGPYLDRRSLYFPGLVQVVQVVQDKIEIVRRTIFSTAHACAYAYKKNLAFYPVHPDRLDQPLFCKAFSWSRVRDCAVPLGPPAFADSFLSIPYATQFRELPR